MRQTVETGRRAPRWASYVGLFSVMALPFAPVQASDSCRSQMVWFYDSKVARASFTFDLPACPLVDAGIGTMKAWVSVQRESSPAVRREVVCEPSSLCHVEVEIEHFEVELAYYRARWEYHTTGPTQIAGFAAQEGGCASYIVRAGCPPPILP